MDEKHSYMGRFGLRNLTLLIKILTLLGTCWQLVVRFPTILHVALQQRANYMHRMYCMIRVIIIVIIIVIITLSRV
jgi:hypothetical protein